MTTNQLTDADKKMLNELKTTSCTKTKLLLVLMYYRFLKFISSLFAMFFFTLLIFSISFIIYIMGFGFSFFVCLIYLASHYAFYSLYLKKRYFETMYNQHQLMGEAVEVVSFRLKNKLYVMKL
jgi:hypothetical protein